MPYSPRDFKYPLALAAAAAAGLVPQFVRPATGSDGALLVTLIPVIAAAWFGSWREALVSVFAGAVAVQFAEPPPHPIFPDRPALSAAFWGTVFAAVGTAGCLTLRHQGRADVATARAAIRERFTRLVETNIVPMFVGTLDGTVAASNTDWTRTFDATGRGGRPARWTDLVAPGASIGAATTAYLEVAFRRHGDPVVGNLFVVRVGGDEVLGVFLDQSAAKRTEAGLRREAEALIEADAKKDEAIDILAHELRNPLAPIRTAGELVRATAESATTADRQRYARIILDQTDVLVRLVDDLLDVSRIRRGKITVQKTTVDLAQLVTRAAESVRPLMTQNRHDLFVGVPTDGPVYLDADPDRMAQVLNNLLVNAAKYTGPGGTVWVSLDREPGTVVLRVRDTGVGIAPDFLPRVFDMFAQHRTGLDRKEGGIGIGLALVKRLVELHGGTVTAHSDGEGRGSEFVVTLPRAALSWKNLPRPASAPPPAKTPRTVLIVEDNWAAAETMAAQLKIEGHTPFVVHEGAVALATAASIRPDVILLDIGLPGMDGYQIASKLREAGTGSVIIAVTGCATEDNRAAGFRAGIDHYLLKPVAFDALRGLLTAPRPAAGTGVGYERLTPTVAHDTRELVTLSGRATPAAPP